MNEQQIIDKAITFLLKRGYKVPDNILSKKSFLSSDEMKSISNVIKEMKAESGYAGIRNDMWAVIYDDVYGYLDSNKQITTFRSHMASAVANAYIKASEQAWIDGGGTLPVDEDTLSWAKSELNAQLQYVDSLFESLKKLRKEGEFDVIHESFIHADGYASALDGFYNYIKAAAYGGKMLTFVGSDGRESCRDCRKLKNERKRASWWVSHNMVPPSRFFECKGYRCDHYLVDDKGNRFTE